MSDVLDTADLEEGRNIGLREAAEFLREEARDYATRAARLRTDYTDAAQEIANRYMHVSTTMRRCSEILDERAAHGPQAGVAQ